MDLNIRDFPDELHRNLKSKAALQGETLKELIIGLLRLYLICDGEIKKINRDFKDSPVK